MNGGPLSEEGESERLVITADPTSHFLALVVGDSEVEEEENEEESREGKPFRKVKISVLGEHTLSS